jgi:hypothetical protein
MAQDPALLTGHSVKPKLDMADSSINHRRDNFPTTTNDHSSLLTALACVASHSFSLAVQMEREPIASYITCQRLMTHEPRGWFCLRCGQADNSDRSLGLSHNRHGNLRMESHASILGGRALQSVLRSTRAKRIRKH